MEVHRLHHQSNLRTKDTLSKPLLRPLEQWPGTPLSTPLCLEQAPLCLVLLPPPPVQAGWREAVIGGRGMEYPPHNALLTSTTPSSYLPLIDLSVAKNAPAQR